MHRLFLAVACGGYSLVAVHELLTAAASLVAKHGLCGAWTLVVVAHRLWWVWRTDFGGVVHRLWWCGHMGSVVAECMLSCSVACGIFPGQGLNPCMPCVDR